MRNPLSATGLVVTAGSSAPHFAGTCFAFSNPHTLLTAEHCVKGLDAPQVTVRTGKEGFEGAVKVLSIARHPTADIAVLRIAQGSGFFDPFVGRASAYELGEEISAFGYPEDTSPSGILPTPRFFRGNIQRLFLHSSHLGYRYSAAELSFPAPGGLSGGPVSQRDRPDLVVGVIAENKQASTYLHTLTEYSEGAQCFSESVHSTIEYGLAVMIDAVKDWLDIEVRGA